MIQLVESPVLSDGYTHGEFVEDAVRVDVDE